MIILIIVIVVIIFVALVFVKINKKTPIKKGDIRFNYRHKHLAHVKKVEGKPPNQKATSVFLSSNDKDEGRDNIPMDKPLKVGENKPDTAYFIKRVRKYPVDTYSKEKLNQKLSTKDKITSNKIYKRHLNNQRLMKKRK